MNELLTNMFSRTTELVGGYVPTLLGAIAVLVAGWIVALIAASIVRGVLHRTSLDNRVARWLVGETTAPVPIERYASGIAFWVVLLFALIAFFQVLSLTVITEPLNALLSQIAEFVPRVLGASILLLVAAVVAAVVRRVLSSTLKTLPFIERLGGDPDAKTQVSQGVADTAYWLVYLLFLPAVLDALAVEGLLTPVQGVLSDLLGFLPNIFGAALVLAVGWFVARLVQRVVTGLLLSTGADRFSDRVGLSATLGSRRLSELAGSVVKILILIPVVIAGLNALRLEAVTAPASSMLATMLGALPSLSSGALLLAIAYLVGRWVTGLVRDVLAGAGFDSVLVRLGLREEGAEMEHTPSQLVASLAFVAIMLVATMEAMGLLGFVTLNGLIAQFLTLTGRVVFGVVLLGLGLLLANVAATTVSATGGVRATLLSSVTRTAILTLAAAVALSQMGIANNIITLAFGLILGAVAVATALAFGLGARDVAARTVEEWTKRFRSE